MSDSSPMPPSELPTDIVNALDSYLPELLRHVAHYAEELAEYRERKARLDDTDDEDEIEKRPENLPDGVPSKATITTKEINNNHYYWQWREGDQIKSKYKGLANSDE